MLATFIVEGYPKIAKILIKKLCQSGVAIFPLKLINVNLQSTCLSELAKDHPKISTLLHQIRDHNKKSAKMIDNSNMILVREGGSVANGSGFFATTEQKVIEQQFVTNITPSAQPKRQ